MNGDPKPLFAVVCENGTLCAENRSSLPIFSNDFHALEERERIRSGGSLCDCDDHRIVKYVPAITETQ